MDYSKPLKTLHNANEQLVSVAKKEKFELAARKKDLWWRNGLSDMSVRLTSAVPHSLPLSLTLRSLLLEPCCGSMLRE